MADLNNARVLIRQPQPPKFRTEVPTPSRAVVVPVAGPAGPAGSAAGAYTYIQSTPAAEWYINHNLGRRTTPTLFLTGVGDDPTEPVYTDLFVPDGFTTIVSWPQPVTGRAEY